MKLALMVACLLLTASLAAAVTYKWEDAKGVHFTDDFNSVPKVLRSRAVTEDESGVMNFGKTMPLQNSSGAKRKNLQEIDRLNEDRDRIVMEAIKQHQHEIIKNYQQSSGLQTHLLKYFARKTVIWLLPLLLFVFFWVLALIDIMRASFTVPTRKYLWLLVVLLLAPFGMVIYYIFGRSQKTGSDAATGNGRHI